MEWTRDRIAQAPLFARPKSGGAEEFAAHELASYLHRIAGRPEAPLQLIEASHPLLILGSATRAPETALPPSGFRIEAGEESIVLAAKTEKDLLQAVYRLLEQLGCRWSLRGRSEEVVPADLRSVRLASEDCPARHSRFGFCSDLVTWHYTQADWFQERLAEDRDFVDWMAKVGADFYFFIRHPFDTQSTIPEFAAECERRGIALEHGGHIIPVLLPRELFTEHPEWFPVAPSGERTGLGNLCASQTAGLDLAAENAIRLLESLPESSALHLWGADLWKGGWCHCSSCRAWSPQDQSLRTCNHLARALEKAGYAVPVCYLAYHDTLDARVSEWPHDLVWCEFAPRERCYAHAIGDSNCSRNRRYWRALERYAELFQGRVRVFEYYGDAILFFGCAMPLTQTIQADLEHYRSLGIEHFSMLEFGAYSRWAYGPNFLSFSRAVTSGADCRYSDDPGERSNAFDWLRELCSLEPCLATLARYGDLRIPPRDPNLAREVVELIASTLPQLAEAASALEAQGEDAALALSRLVRYTQAVCAAVEHELRTGSAPRDVYATALELLQGVDRRWKGVWGELDLPTIHTLYEAAPLAMFFEPEPPPE